MPPARCLHRRWRFANDDFFRFVPFFVTSSLICYLSLLFVHEQRDADRVDLFKFVRILFLLLLFADPLLGFWSTRGAIYDHKNRRRFLDNFLGLRFLLGCGLNFLLIYKLCFSPLSLWSRAGIESRRAAAGVVVAKRKLLVHIDESEDDHARAQQGGENHVEQVSETPSPAGAGPSSGEDGAPSWRLQTPSKTSPDDERSERLVLQTQQVALEEDEDDTKQAGAWQKIDRDFRHENAKSKSLGQEGINSGGRHEHDHVGSATSSLPARQRAFLDLVTSREFQFGDTDEDIAGGGAAGEDVEGDEEEGSQQEQPGDVMKDGTDSGSRLPEAITGPAVAEDAVAYRNSAIAAIAASESRSQLSGGGENPNSHSLEPSLPALRSAHRRAESPRNAEFPAPALRDNKEKDAVADAEALLPPIKISPRPPHRTPGPVKLNKTSPTPARQAHFLVAETIALCALLLHTLFSSVVLFFLFFVFSDSKRGGSTRSDLLIRKLILDVRLKKPDGTEETSFLLGRWTRNLIERVLRILGTPEQVKDVLLTYVATLVGNANLCWSDFQAATDLAVSPNFGGRVALPYVEEGTEIDFSKKSDDAALRLCFEFINYSDIVYGWPQFCKMAIGDSRKIWNLVTQIDVNPQNSVCVGDNYLQLNERAILLMLYHRERQYLLKQKFSVVVSKKVSGFDVGGAPVGAAGTSTGGAASTTSAANRSHGVEVEEVAGDGVDVDHAAEVQDVEGEVAGTSESLQPLDELSLSRTRTAETGSVGHHFAGGPALEGSKGTVEEQASTRTEGRRERDAADTTGAGGASWEVGYPTCAAPYEYTGACPDAGEILLGPRATRFQREKSKSSSNVMAPAANAKSATPGAALYPPTTDRILMPSSATSATSSFSSSSCSRPRNTQPEDIGSSASTLRSRSAPRGRGALAASRAALLKKASTTTAASRSSKCRATTGCGGGSGAARLQELSLLADVFVDCTRMTVTDCRDAKNSLGRTSHLIGGATAAPAAAAPGSSSIATSTTSGGGALGNVAVPFTRFRELSQSRARGRSTRQFTKCRTTGGRGGSQFREPSMPATLPDAARETAKTGNGLPVAISTQHAGPASRTGGEKELVGANKRSFSPFVRSSVTTTQSHMSHQLPPKEAALRSAAGMSTPLKNNKVLLAAAAGATVSSSSRSRRRGSIEQAACGTARHSFIAPTRAFRSVSEGYVGTTTSSAQFPERQQSGEAHARPPHAAHDGLVWLQSSGSGSRPNMSEDRESTGFPGSFPNSTLPPYSDDGSIAFALDIEEGNAAPYNARGSPQAGVGLGAGQSASTTTTSRMKIPLLATPNFAGLREDELEHENYERSEVFLGGGRTGGSGEPASSSAVSERERAGADPPAEVEVAGGPQIEEGEGRQTAHQEDEQRAASAEAGQPQVEQQQQDDPQEKRIQLWYGNFARIPGKSSFWIVICDHLAKALIVAISGTNYMAEIATNFVLECAPLCEVEDEDEEDPEGRGASESSTSKENYVHVGMLGCAEQILETFQREGFLDRVPEGYRLVFTGHSMGAGVASICSLLFRRKFRDRVKPDSAVGEREGEPEPPEDGDDAAFALMQKEDHHEQELCEVDPPADEADRRIPMSAVLLCPPGWTMSPKLAAETRAFSVTIVTSYDNIPRSRPDTLIRFREHMCYLLERVRLSKWKIFLINRYQCCRRRYEPQVEELCEYGPGSSDGSPYNRPTPAVMKKVASKSKRKIPRPKELDAPMERQARASAPEVDLHDHNFAEALRTSTPLLFGHLADEQNEPRRSQLEQLHPPNVMKTASSLSSFGDQRGGSVYVRKEEAGFNYRKLIRMRGSLFSNNEEHLINYPRHLYDGNYRDIFLPLATPGRVMQLRLTKRSEAVETWAKHCDSRKAEQSQDELAAVVAIPIDVDALRHSYPRNEGFSTTEMRAGNVGSEMHIEVLGGPSGRSHAGSSQPGGAPSAAGRSRPRVEQDNAEADRIRSSAGAFRSEIELPEMSPALSTERHQSSGSTGGGLRPPEHLLSHKMHVPNDNEHVGIYSSGKKNMKRSKQSRHFQRRRWTRKHTMMKRPYLREHVAHDGAAVFAGKPRLGSSDSLTTFDGFTSSSVGFGASGRQSSGKTSVTGAGGFRHETAYVQAAPRTTAYAAAGTAPPQQLRAPVVENKTLQVRQTKAKQQKRKRGLRIETEPPLTGAVVYRRKKIALGEFARQRIRRLQSAHRSGRDLLFSSLELIGRGSSGGHRSTNRQLRYGYASENAAAGVNGAALGSGLGGGVGGRSDGGANSDTEPRNITDAIIGHVFLDRYNENGVHEWLTRYTKIPKSSSRGQLKSDKKPRRAEGANQNAGSSSRPHTASTHDLAAGKIMDHKAVLQSKRGISDSLYGSENRPGLRVQQEPSTQLQRSRRRASANVDARFMLSASSPDDSPDGEITSHSRGRARAESELFLVQGRKLSASPSRDRVDKTTSWRSRIANSTSTKPMPMPARKMQSTAPPRPVDDWTKPCLGQPQHSVELSAHLVQHHDRTLARHRSSDAVEIKHSGVHGTTGASREHIDASSAQGREERRDEEDVFNAEDGSSSNTCASARSTSQKRPVVEQRPVILRDGKDRLSLGEYSFKVVWVDPEIEMSYCYSSFQAATTHLLGSYRLSLQALRLHCLNMADSGVAEVEEEIEEGEPEPGDELEEEVGQARPLGGDALQNVDQHEEQGSIEAAGVEATTTSAVEEEQDKQKQSAAMSAAASQTDLDGNTSPPAGRSDDGEDEALVSKTNETRSEIILPGASSNMGGRLTDFKRVTFADTTSPRLFTLHGEEELV